MKLKNISFNNSLTSSLQQQNNQKYFEIQQNSLTNGLIPKNKNYILIFMGIISSFILSNILIFSLIKYILHSEDVQKGTLIKDINEILIYEEIENRLKREEKEKFLAKNNITKEKYKEEILKKFPNEKKKEIKTIAITGKQNFGNAIVVVSNAILFCEIIGCERLILFKNDTSFIKNPVIDKEYNLTIEPYREIDCKNKDIDILCIDTNIFYYKYPAGIIPVSRLDVFKNEVLKAIPEVNTDPNDLYINIRSGDIFIKQIHKDYSQPPLCFYTKIINNFSFKNIYIVANGKENPIVNKLLELYPNIKYKHGSVEYDASLVLNAYNLVAPISSFSIMLIQFSEKLKNLFEYDFITNGEKICWLIKDEQKSIKRVYKHYLMKPSSIYTKKMRFWKKSKEQLDLMINDKCENNFIEFYGN